jgi:hypothetical protein
VVSTADVFTKNDEGRPVNYIVQGIRYPNHKLGEVTGDGKAQLFKSNGAKVLPNENGVRRGETVRLVSPSNVEFVNALNLNMNKSNNNSVKMPNVNPFNLMGSQPVEVAAARKRTARVQAAAITQAAARRRTARLQAAAAARKPKVNQARRG